MLYFYFLTLTGDHELLEFLGSLIINWIAQYSYEIIGRYFSVSLTREVVPYVVLRERLQTARIEADKERRVAAGIGLAIH